MDRRPSSLSADDVKAYLRAHPELLEQDQNLLSDLTPPTALGNGQSVTDIRDVVVARLRHRIASLEDQHHRVLAASNANALAQEQVHAAILDLLNAHSFEELVDYVTQPEGLSSRLNISALTLCIEAETSISGIGTRGLRILERGGVGRLLPEGQKVLLTSHVQGSRSLYGALGDQVNSEALVRLEISPQTPPGLIAFGAESSGYFHPAQASDLLCFLTGVLERSLRHWLALPQGK